ncbi:MAG TPA: metal ABC transporter substrate-binding protein [Streptosporangiaceae bacterium]
MLTHRPRPWRATAAVCAAATLLGAAACGGDRAKGGGEVSIIGSFYPMAWVARRVAGSAASVTTLTKPGAEPHDIELTPRQVVAVAQADLVVYVKGLQPAVDQAVDRHAADRSIDAASLVPTLSAASTGSAATGSSAGGGPRDPHLWLDPDRLATVATAVGARLAKVDQAHAATYEANARALGADLHALDGEFAAGLRDCGYRTIVTSHAAFGYLAERYRLTQVSVAGIDPQNEPSPQRLAALTGEIRRTGVTTVFTETLVSPKVAQTLAREAGVRTATLDPVEGLPAGAKGNYLSIMRRNLQTLRTALECR